MSHMQVCKVCNASLVLTPGMDETGKLEYYCEYCDKWYITEELKLIS